MINYGYIEKNQLNKLTDFHLWRRIFTFIRPQLALLIITIILSLCITAATLALPHVLQLAIDNSITAAHLAVSQRLSLLTRDACWYGLLVIVVFALSFIQILLLQKLGQEVMHNLRQGLFRHLLDLDLSFFSSTPTGQLVTRLTNDINNMNEMFTSVIVTLFNDILRITGILIILLWMNLPLALIMSCFLPIAIGMTLFFSKLAREAFRRVRSQLAKMNSYLSETLANIEILQIFNKERHSLLFYGKLTKEYLHRTLYQIKLFGFFMPLTELLSSTAIAIILWYGGGQILQQHLSLGELVAFLTYMRLFFQPLREGAQKYSIVQSAMASAERIFELLDTSATIIERTAPVSLPAPKGEILFREISFCYQPGEKVLNKINLHIPAGKTVAIVGATGSGKSTLVNLLLRFHDPDEGSINFDGIDIKNMKLHQLRGSIGVILQDIFILQGSLLANIVLDRTTTRTEIEKILKETRMDRFVNKLPQGLDTIIGDGGISLSTGEKQLLAFARVLCQKPAVLILDEATAAIDTESENILEEVIAKSFAGRSSLVIAHRLSTIRRADHIIVMANGEIVEQGSHSSLLTADGQYAQMIKMDMKREH